MFILYTFIYLYTHIWIFLILQLLLFYLGCFAYGLLKF